MSLILTGVAAGYRRVRVLHDIGHCFAAGTVTALLGPNGSGKSTLLKVVAGLLPYEGRIERDGAIGYLPQDQASQPVFNVFETVLLGRLAEIGLRIGGADVAAVEQALATVGIAHLAERRLEELSGGQRQLAFIAQVLAAQRRILVLDEPTSALDPRHHIQILRTLRRLTRERGLTTIIAVHDLNAAIGFADELVMLRDGRVRAHGAPAAVLDPVLLESVYDITGHTGIAPDGLPFVVWPRA